MKRVLLTLLGLLCLSETTFAEEPAKRPPNVVLIVADDLGYAGIGAQGCRDIATPAIDSIAAAGIRFTNGYVPCPVCAPTRAGLLTGRYPQRFGFEHNPGSEQAASPEFGIPAEEPILAERLKAAGYATGMVGKWHVGYRRELQPPSRGFDSFFGFLSGANDFLPSSRGGRNPILRGFDPVEEREYLTDAFAREAVAFIDAQHERPFLLYMPFSAVHAPLQATERYRERFPGIEDPTRRTHAAMLAAMDDAVGAILGALRRHGLEEHTIVVFLSDNGGPTPQTTSRNDPLRGFKGQVYEGGVRVPFLVQWKGALPSGKVEDRPVIALDVVPTVLGAVGVPVEGGRALDGVNLLPYLRGEATGRPHEALFWRMGRQSAVRLGDLKLVVRDGVSELFDLAADTGESRDLARERPADLARLQAAFAEWERGTVAAKWVRNEGARDAAAPPVARPGTRGGVEQRFRALDRDGDGRVSRAEGESIGQVFDTLDADQDGFVTLEEARSGTARGAEGRRSPAPAQDPPPAPASSEFGLPVEGVTIALAARDPGGLLRFYREGLGMKEVAPDTLELFGTRLRISSAGASASGLAHGPQAAWRRALAGTGIRYLSVWLSAPEATCDRLERAGYERPAKAASVWLTADPEGNVVELMGVPPRIPGEALTAVALVEDDAAGRRFYGETLGLVLLDTWHLPPPAATDMHVYALGSCRIKVAARPAAGSPAQGTEPGPRTLTLHVRVPGLDPVAARLAAAGAVLTREAESVVALEPGGSLLVLERGATGPAPGSPPPGPSAAPQEGARSAALFERVQVAGLTDVRAGTNGLAIVDLDRDGRLDLLLPQSAPRGSARAWTEGETLRVLVNEGSFRFRPHDLSFLDSSLTMGSFARGQVPGLADFDGDGRLDLLVTRHATMTAGQPNARGLPSVGNTLFLAVGRWDAFKDVSAQAGIRNETAYNRQPSLGDVNRDGWLDVAIGCDNIGNAMGGVPWSRLYVFRPKGDRFEDGRFEDIGGTDLVPDFGGFYHDSAKDKAGPDINLCDLDNDGDLDLLQSYHVDVRDPALPFSPVEYRQGVFCWKNLLAETGALRFEKVVGNGLACEARLELDDDKKTVTPVGKAPGLPYISLADVDNDGLMDVLAVGPASPGWAPRTEYVGGRFWRNLGGLRFEECTEAAGLEALAWGYGRWAEFFGTTLPAGRPGAPVRPADRLPYFADAVFGDYDNDGWIDVVVLDRSEGLIQGRAVLFHNRGDATFEPTPPLASGIDASGICGEAADLDGDGLLDLVFAADPDNSGLASDPSRYEDRVYRNTGAGGARAHHWLRLRFTGVRDAELIGARVEAREPGTGRLFGTRWIHANHSYKSGGALEAHFGLGPCAVLDVEVVLPSGRRVAAPAVAADRYVEFHLTTGAVSPVDVQ